MIILLLIKSIIYNKYIYYNKHKKRALYNFKSMMTNTNYTKKNF